MPALCTCVFLRSRALVRRWIRSEHLDDVQPVDEAFDVGDTQHADDELQPRPVDSPGAVLQQVEDADREVIVFAVDDVLAFPMDTGLLRG